MSQTTKLFGLAALLVTILPGSLSHAQQMVGNRSSRSMLAADERGSSNTLRRTPVQSGQAKRMLAEDRSRHAGRVQTTGTVERTSYVPRHLRQQEPAAAGGAGEVIATPEPRTYYEVPDDGGETVGSGCASCGVGGGDVDPGVGGDWFDGGCSTCGVNEACDCPRPRCWFDCMGGLFLNSEFFAGAQAYQGYGLDQEAAFGFHAGFNTGLPLNWLTCGLFSGQFGMNATFSDLASQDNSPTQQQVFYTAGVFRRVDYGLQGGVVGDVLDASSNIDPRLVQVRGELSWAYPSHYVFGFRATKNVQDHDGETVLLNTLDTYRCFFQTPAWHGGFSEVEAGWTDQGSALIGSRCDIPFTSCWALRSGFTYLIPDESDQDAWNIYLGMSFRPRGAAWYNFYHRPLFDVADNGSMIVSQ